MSKNKEKQNNKIYDREVTRFLFKYILLYKNHLFLSLFFMLIVTGVNLMIPIMSKIIIDRYIMKSGYLIEIKNLEKNPGLNINIRKKLSSSIHLSPRFKFLLKSKAQFSQSEITVLQKSQILTDIEYILIEKVQSQNITELETYIRNNTIQTINKDTLLIPISVYQSLSLDKAITLRNGDIIQILLILLIMLFLLFLNFISSYKQQVTLFRLSNYAMRDLRQDLFRHITSYELNYFDSVPIGKLVSRVTNDIQVLNEMFSSVLVPLFQDIILLIGIGIIIFNLNLTLAMTIAVIFPFIITTTIIFRIKANKVYRKIRELVAQINAFFNEAISGVRIIQIFTAEKKMLHRFDGINQDLYKTNLRQMYIYAFFRPLIGFYRWLVIAGVIYISIQGIQIHTISYGMLVLFLGYIRSFFQPIQDMAEKFDIMISATAAGEKILRIIKTDIRREITETTESDTEVSEFNNGLFQGQIIFQNVWFAYKKDDYILKDFSLSINPLEKIAIVGETGAGKTTITNLLTRFYDIQKGSIQINNKPLSQIPYHVLRNNIALVMQDVFLFSKTIKENIILNSDYDDKRFNLVTKITHVDQILNKLKNRENEMVMERGHNFSAGERQLLSFARALYKDPAVLILDEATSNIDSETEKLIQDAIEHLIQGRTSIIIAHRLSTIKNSNRIIVLDKGKIVEHGNHQELINKKGFYYNLYRLQFLENTNKF